MDATLSAVHVGHDYGNGPVLTDVTFILQPGEIVSLVGANGVGKTTLVRVLCGVIQPQRGSVVVGGFDVLRHRQEALRRVGYVADVPFFYTRLRGYEHLAVTASIFSGEVERALSVAGRLGLSDDLLESAVGELSLGNKKKLALAMAFCGDIRLLIMDEPFASLDAESKETACRIVADYAASGGSVLFVTHDDRDLVLATRGYTMRDGTLHDADATHEVRA